MLSRLALQILVTLQLLAALAWPASASAGENAQHAVLHAVLAQHHHNDTMAHHHDHDHCHDNDLQLNAPDAPYLASSEANAEHHHHHDFNVNMALLPMQSQLAARAPAIQNPRILPAMHSAERRMHLRPPQA